MSKPIIEVEKIFAASVPAPDVDKLAEEFAAVLKVEDGVSTQAPVVAKIGASLPAIEEVDEEHYALGRTDSDATALTDMLDEILREHEFGDDDFEDVEKEYSTKAVMAPSPTRVAAEEELEKFMSERKRRVGRVAHKALSKEEIAAEKKEYLAKKKIMEGAAKKLGDVEPEYGAELADGKTHLFRGKNLTAKIVDPETGDLRFRTREEVYEYATRRFAGDPLYSDGVATIAGDAVAKAEAREKVRKYIADIKSGVRNTSLFNAGPRYSAAVRELMELTGVRGNPVVATAKFPWVAAEYGVGQMGGASGDGRGTTLGDKDGDRPVGYDKDRRPVHRVLANSFVVSMTMADYRKLREDNDLIDVNVDAARGLKPNMVIEEVTFNSRIDGKHVMASLPIVLPRFDRDYEDMSEEKRAQYLRVFGLDETKYKELQTKFREDSVDMGFITEHLVQHHGNLLRALAVKIDRASGYEGEYFVVPYNQSYHSRPHIGVMASPGGDSLSSRAARVGSASKSGSYVSDGSLYAQIARVRNDGRFYADDELNSLMESHLAADTHYIAPAIAAVPDDLEESIDGFINGDQNQAVIAIHDGVNHFMAVHINRNDDGSFSISYFDPVIDPDSREPLHPLPDHIAAVFEARFPGVEPVNTTSVIQTFTTQANGKLLIDNNHCGAFVCAFMAEMTHGRVRLNSDNGRIQVRISEDDWCEIDVLSKAQSNELGEAIRNSHLLVLSGQEILDEATQEASVRITIADFRDHAMEEPEVSGAAAAVARSPAKPTARPLLKELNRADGKDGREGGERS